MELYKKLLIYPLAITSLYLSPTEGNGQNYGGFVANHAVGNYSGEHKHECKNHRNDNFHLDTAQVKNQIDSLEKLMTNKEQFYNETHKSTRLINTTAGKIALGVFGTFALIFLGSMITTTIKEWNDPD